MELEAMGWRVVEVWEHEVREDPAGVVRRIGELAKERE
jgi:very-short-patch-repair endonuclease